MSYSKPIGFPVRQELYIILMVAVMLALIVGSVVLAEEPGALVWRYSVGGAITWEPAIDENGTIYIGSYDHNLYAINPDGSLKWKYKTGGKINSSPAIGRDGNIYFGSDDGHIYALGPKGELKWKYNTGFKIRSSPAIGENGGIYFGTNGDFFALNQDGSLNWRIRNGGFTPAISRNNTIYFGSWDNYIYAVSSSGKLKWKYKTGDRVLGHPAIGKNNTIYFGSWDNYIYAVSSSGKLKWKYKTGGKINSSPAIGRDGNIYFGSDDGYLYSLNLSGDLKWFYTTEGPISSSPSIGKNGTIYVGSKDNHLYAINSDGTLKWSHYTGENVYSSLISKSGVVYTVSFEGKLKAFKTNSKEPANSPWPMYGRNLKNTARAGTKRLAKANLTVKVTNDSGSSLDVNLYLNGEYRGETGRNGKYRISDLSPGSYRIKAKKEGYSSSNVTVHLSPGEEEQITLTLEKKNKPPDALFASSPTHPKTNQTVQFNSNSTDPDGTMDEYRWTLGDGSTSTSKNPTHFYDEPGTYKVELTVTDNDGSTDSITKEVTVVNRKPTAKFSYSPKEPTIDKQITFDGTSSTDEDGTVETYQWNLTGDGETDKSGSEVTYTYDTEGTYRVKLTVTDNNGDSAFTTQEVKVTEKEEEVKIEDKYALVMGIADYKSDTINDLKYPAEDAKDFYRFLINDNYESFPKENVTLLTNQQATSEAIRQEMSQLVAEVNNNDLVIIYYSGHGAPGPDYNNDEQDGYDEYYVTYDTNTASGAKLYSTGISDDQFGNWLTSMDSKQVAIFIDSCYSGGATKAAKGTSIPGQKALPNNEVFNDFSFENRLLFAASSENQPSWESPELNQGVFTHFLLQGLKGKADSNNDGQVTSDELYGYLKPNVSNYVDEHFTANQTPLMKGAISAPLAEKKGKLTGEVKYVKGAQKDRADKGEYVVINLGKEDGVKVEDKFEVLYATKGVGVIEGLSTKIVITDVVGSHLAVGKVVESGLTVEKGYRVRRVKPDSAE